MIIYYKGKGMKWAEKYKINLFLFQFKGFAQKTFTFFPRDKSMDAIARLGIYNSTSKAGNIRADI